MANKNAKPPKASQWKKGQSGNPLGAQLHDPAVKAIKALTKQELADIGNLVVKGDIFLLKDMANAETGVTALQAMIASVAVRVIEKGDMQAMDILLNRLIGKVRDEVMHSGDLNIPQVVVTLPSNGYEAKKDDKPK